MIFREHTPFISVITLVLGLSLFLLMLIAMFVQARQQRRESDPLPLGVGTSGGAASRELPCYKKYRCRANPCQPAELDDSLCDSLASIAEFDRVWKATARDDGYIWCCPARTDGSDAASFRLPPPKRIVSIV